MKGLDFFSQKKTMARSSNPCNRACFHLASDNTAEVPQFAE
jgi:hypothetical protein